MGRRNISSLRSFLIISITFIPSYLGAAALPPGAKQELLDDFSGGLNTSIPSHKVPKNFSPYMRNVFIDDGKIQRINGYVTLGSSRTLAKVTGIFPFVRESGQTTFLVTDSSITLETGDFKSWVFVSSGSNFSSLLTWMQVRNKMWGFNGVDFVKTYDGATTVILNGNNGTPNVPKFRFGAYYQDRVWGFSIPAGASDLYFSATITTDNIIIAPDNQFAWPSNFATYVGRGDGQIGTALWIYQGMLRAGKEQSIYTIYGDNPSNYLPRKEEASLGVASNESVRILDGDSHLLGSNGIYRNANRISDLIEPDIANINKGVTDVVSNTWETQSDFARGQFVFGSTANPEGFVFPSSSTFRLNYNGFTDQTTLPTSGFTTFPVGAFATDFVARVPTETVPANYSGVFRPGPGSVFIWARCECTTDQSFTLTSTIKNMNTGQSASNVQVSNVINNGTFQQIRIFDDSVNLRIPFTAQDINLSSLTIKISVADPGNSNHLTIFPATSTSFANLALDPSTTAQYISDIATATTVTAWGNFDSVNNSNGGNILYYFRTSTSVVNIATRTWQTIAPGAIINAPILERYFQWASTIQSIGNPASNIDNVVISHIEGQASDARAFAMDWNNRYWLTVTTGSDNTMRLTYVKSKNTNQNPNAWMAIEGYPIDSYAKAGEILYGGSASTGSVYRLDYGTNFDGAPINSIYDTPDLPLGDYFFDKYIHKYVIEGLKSPGEDMSVYSSFNQGNFVASTFSISGTGRYSHIIEGVVRSAKTDRLRFQNGQLDSAFNVNTANIFYENTGVLSNK